MKHLAKKYSLSALVASLMLSAHVQAATTVAELIEDISFVDVITAIFSIGTLVIMVDVAQIAYQRVRRHIKGAAY